jgi:hypothetical protein
MVAPPPPGPEDLPRRNYRHMRTTITLLILTGFVVWAGLRAWSEVEFPVTDEDNPLAEVLPDPTCAAVAPTNAPTPAEIGLNVYNATEQSGLAQRVAGVMRERGFAILDVANDPTTRTVVHVAEIRASSLEHPGVGLVMAHFPGSVFFADERPDESVDLVLGPEFEGVAPAPAPGAVATPEGTATPLPPC